MIDVAIEEAVIHAFIRKEKQARWLELNRNQPGRNKLRAALAHFNDFVPETVAPVPAHQQHTTSIHRLLSGLGAPNTCYLLSENVNCDAQQLDLKEALLLVVGYGYGTLISCQPGVLAYFEGEGPGERLILKKKLAPTRS